MANELSNVLNRLFASPVRRAVDAPPRGLSKDGPICDMPDEQKMLTAKIVLLWSTMGACACNIVEKLAALSETHGNDWEEKRKLYLEMLNMILNNMDLLLPVVQAVTKFGLKHALLNAQLDRCDAAISDLEFLESFKAEVLGA